MSSHGPVLHVIDKKTISETALQQAYSELRTWGLRNQEQSSEIDQLFEGTVDTKLKERIKHQLVNLHHVPPPPPSKFRKFMGESVDSARDYLPNSPINQKDRPRYLNALDKLDKNNPDDYYSNAQKAIQKELHELTERYDQATVKIQHEIQRERAAAERDTNPTNKSKRLAELTSAEERTLELIADETENYRQNLLQQEQALTIQYAKYKAQRENRQYLPQEEQDALKVLEKYPYVLDPDSPEAANINFEDINAEKPGETLGKLLKASALSGYRLSEDGKSVQQTGKFGAMLPIPEFVNKWFGAVEQEQNSFVPGAENVKRMYEIINPETNKPFGVGSFMMDDHLKKLYEGGTLRNLNKALQPGNFSAFDLGMAIAGLIVRCRMDNAYRQVQVEERKLALKNSDGKEGEFTDEKFKAFVEKHSAKYNIEKLDDLKKIIDAEPGAEKELKDMGIEVRSGKNVQIVNPPITIKPVKGAGMDGKENGPFPPDGNEPSFDARYNRKHVLDESAKEKMRAQDKSHLLGIMKNVRLESVAKSTNENTHAGIQMRGS